MEIREHLEDYLPEEGAREYLWRDILWAIWGSASENGGKVIKAAPKELKEKYQQVFA